MCDVEFGLSGRLTNQDSYYPILLNVVFTVTLSSNGLTFDVAVHQRHVPIQEFIDFFSEKTLTNTNVKHLKVQRDGNT